MIWGTPIGSEEFEKRIYRPGDRIFVGKGQACGMNFTDGVWAVEYARGPLMLSMPFGIADELFSALDLSTAVQTISMYTSLIGRHWANKANRDYPVLLPFKRVAALFMNLLGPAITKSLTPPPPIEINPPKPVRAIAVGRGRARGRAVARARTSRGA